ncbi:hypothetical protein LTR66_003822 [Elasticomyces elasticus]|nr:hypothetical protein LTR50_004965 [Elasticomyces elasticus]KAK4996594.1 hypothetical protein LTR66_003822 [Elasticomyces elasticus]
MQEQQVSFLPSLPEEKQGFLVSKSSVNYEPGHTPVEAHNDYQFDRLRPRFPNVHWPALAEVPYVDKGLFGHPGSSNLLEFATEVVDYAPKIGTEITGIKLRSLTDVQRNDLARLVATRGVVIFRGQDDFDIDAQRELGSYFGTLHKHATTSVPLQEGLEDVHVIFMEGTKDMRAMFTKPFLWHSDVTYELQPLAYTSLKLLSGPPQGGGGDTLWCSQYAAYDALSPLMQQFLEKLTALHSAKMQADGSRAFGRTVRREPIVTEHPLIRTHPVTGWKSLFFNPGFVTAIKGVPKTESDHIIGYLTEIVSTTYEAQARFQLRRNDVAIWDNRICNHTATYGFAPHRRHAVRVACHGERPVFDPAGTSQEEDYCARYGLPQINKDCTGLANYND